VGEVVIHLHFHHLGIDHDEAQFLGAEFVENGSNDGIDAD
jgi:hypothetical protein